MAPPTTILVLYAVVLVLAGAATIMTILLVRLLWREKRCADQRSLDSGYAASHERGGSSPGSTPADPRPVNKLSARQIPESLQFTENDYPPPKNRLHFRPAFEPIGEYARTQRIKDGRDRQDVRAALSSLANNGTYVFADLLTDEGSIDFLTISRAGIHMVYVRMHEGFVWRSGTTDIIFHMDDMPHINPVTGEEMLRGKVLPEDLDTVCQQIALAYQGEVHQKKSEPSWTIQCFTRAEIQPQSDSYNSPRGMCPLLDLAPSISWKDESELKISEARLLELAETTANVYSRQPFVLPTGVESDR